VVEITCCDVGLPSRGLQYPKNVVHGFFHVVRSDLSAFVEPVPSSLCENILGPAKARELKKMLQQKSVCLCGS
jgi:hypothetical protein